MGCVRSRQKKVPAQPSRIKIRTAVFDPIRYIEIAFVVDKKTLCIKCMDRAIAGYLADFNSTYDVENRVYSGLIVDRDTHAVIQMVREKQRFEGGGCGRVYSRFKFGHVFIFLYNMTDMNDVTHARKELDALKSDIKCITPVLMIGYQFNVFGAWQKECPLFCGRTDFACVFSTLCRDILYHIASYLFLLYAPIDKINLCLPEYCVQSYHNDFEVEHDHILLLDEYSIMKCLDAVVDQCNKNDLGTRDK